MMSGEAWLFLLAVLVNAVNLFLQVFFTIMYSDLEWYAPHRQLSAARQRAASWPRAALPCSRVCMRN
jgi:hypothetical protein